MERNTNKAPAPKLDKEVRVCFRLWEELALEMDLVVMRERSSRSNFLRDAIKEKVEREKLAA